MTNSWSAAAADEPEASPSSPSRQHQRQQQQQQQQQPAVPDAVINMAAKVGSDKKPFAYVADVNDIRQQRDRVRRKYVHVHSLLHGVGPPFRRTATVRDKVRNRVMVWVRVMARVRVGLGFNKYGFVFV